MKKKVFLATTFIIAGVLIGVILNPLISEDNIYNQVKKFEFILGTSVKNYVEDVDTQKLTEAAVKGMLDELDPHSVYINAEKMKSVREDFSGSFEGVGVQFDIINDTLTVISPIAGGPSEELGIQAGDKIIKIDGEDAVGIERSEVPKKLKGPKGTKVTVDIVRTGANKVLHFEIIRDKIPLYTVDAAFMVDKTDIGVVVVNRFAQKTHAEFLEAVSKLKKQGMKKLVLDLRGNPGGYLSQAFYLADEFLPAGDTIVYTQGRRDEFNEAFISSYRGNVEEQPLIILINQGSASASEIVSGSVQDLDRGLIVGVTSFGKGLVQRQYDVGDGSAFRLTISRYYTPSGRCIQRPYEDEKAYRRLFGRLELEEGANIEHALEKIKTEMGDDDKEDEGKMMHPDSIPLYSTRKGRPVLGGGGITPDYIIKSDTLTDLSIDLRRNRIMYEYVNNYLNSGKDLKQKYNSDFLQFYRNFEVSDNDIKRIKKLAEKKDIEWNEDDYDTDEEFIKTELKAILARVMWDREKYIQVFFDIDRQLQKSIELFPEAIKIAGN